MALQWAERLSARLLPYSVFNFKIYSFTSALLYPLIAVRNAGEAEFAIDISPILNYFITILSNILSHNTVFGKRIIKKITIAIDFGEKLLYNSVI